MYALTMKTKIKTIGEALRGIREARGLSLGQVQALVKIDKGRISNIENNFSELPLVYIQKLNKKVVLTTNEKKMIEEILVENFKAKIFEA